MGVTCRAGVLAGVLVLVLAIAGIAAAQPAPALDPPPPFALKQGQSIELKLGGQNLGRIASTSVADARGLTVEPIKPEKPSETEIKLKLSAAADAALGDRELRLLGPDGVARPLRVLVTQYDVITDKEPNNVLSQAQEITLPATLVGRVDGAGDVDQFRFNATKGQQLVFDIQANRIGSPLEAVATIHSTDGREKHFRIEHRGRDPVLLFEPPEDGQYVLRLRDLEYRGGPEYDYRITAGQIPYLEGLLPSSGQPGKVIEAQAVGYNLKGGEKVTIDLSMIAPGTINVRTKTDLGFSNEAPFEVTELPQTVEEHPNDKPEQANAVALPAEISGHIAKSGDEGFFKFHVPYKQPVNLEVLAGRFGSPVVPLLQLRNLKGETIDSNDGTPDADARIVRELDPGDYLVSVRDLTFAGGKGHWYRLKIEPAAVIRQDFAVRFMPDAPRIRRGGNCAVWCEVKRTNGFKGEVTITPEGLPAGVSAPTIKIGEDASGWFTLAASNDAALGSVPIKLKATATIGTVPVTHEAQPEIAGRAVAEAYLTVLPPAPFNVEAVAMMTPQRIEQMNGEIQLLTAKLTATDPRFDASLAEWLKKVSNRPDWVVLNPASAASSKSTPLLPQPDGSVLASGNFPAQDLYTITAHTDLKGITAIRLEVLADDRLPAHGPGAAPNGNFVLSEFKLTASTGSQPPQAVAFRRASADFSQNGFPIAAAIDNNPGTGWAIDPQQGRSHVAVFETASPIGSEDVATLTLVLDCESIFPQHNIGRFRISVTTADPATLATESDIPQNILAIARTPKELRSAEQTNELVNYFRSIDPVTAPDRNRLEALRSFIAPYAEMARLEQALKNETPQLQAEQTKWEQALAAGAGWSVLDVGEVKSANGAQLVREPDGSIFAGGSSPPVDTYTIQSQTPLKGVTAIRLEVLPDPRLRGNGPGRAENGNFVLTRFRAIATNRGPTSQPSAPEEIAFASARATTEQQGYGIAGALDDKNETGWAILPDVGRPAEATFYPARQIGAVDGSKLTLTLEQLSAFPQHTIGRFRLWVTTNPQPDAALRVPENIAAILKVPAGGRSDPQKQQLARYFRSIAPSLDPLRQRLADLRASMPTMPFKAQKNRGGAIPVPINRIGDFKGDVQVTLEGFNAGRENDMPRPISRSLKLNPLTIPGDKLFGTLTFEAENGAETGTRLVVLKAESKIGTDTVTEYSPAFPLTIEK
jgi:hypothetical protein